MPPSQALPINRPELHFVNFLLETVPLVLGFARKAQRLPCHGVHSVILRPIEWLIVIGSAMRQTRERTTSRTGQRALVWAAVAALSLLLASMLQAMATKALVEPMPSSSTVDVSPATAALADGDNVRARFLASLRSPRDSVPGRSLHRRTAFLHIAETPGLSLHRISCCGVVRTDDVRLSVASS